MKRAAFCPILVVLLVVVPVGLIGAATAPTAPTAVTGAVTSVQPTSVIVDGTVNPKGAATSWYFQYGQSSTPGFLTRTAAKNAGGGTADVHVSITLSGLDPSTSYDYRLIATSRLGTVAGGTGFFNTSAAPGAVTTTASSITATTAMLNGVLSPQGLVTNWYFQYGATTAYGSRTPQKALAASPGAVNVNATITNLAPHATYHFRLVAVSNAGTTRGADVAFTTGLAVTLNAATSTVVYGQYVTLSGAVASGQPNVQVTVLVERFDQSAYATLAAVTTGAGGTWTYSAQPVVRTSYEASTSNGTSSSLLISARPLVTLNKAAGGQLTTKVTGAESFAGHVLQLQRLIGNSWVTWKHVRLNGRGVATFTTSLPKGRTSLRMAIGPFITSIDQAGPGYLAGYSRTITYVR